MWSIFLSDCVSKRRIVWKLKSQTTIFSTMRISGRIAVIVGVSGVLLPMMFGCKVGPDYKRPRAPLAPSYTQQTVVETAQNPSAVAQVAYQENTAPPTPENHFDAENPNFAQAPVDPATWWEQIDDPVLSRILDEAVGRGSTGSNNLTLREMAYRVQQSRAQLGVTRSELFPQVSGDGSYTLTRPAGMNRWGDGWGLGASMNWELDVFGRLQRYTDAAMSDLQAQQELYRDTYVMLLAEIATQYVTARTLQRQILIAEDNILIRRRTLEMTEEKIRVGTSAELDRQQAKGSLASIEAELPDLRATLQKTYNRLSVLMGKPPGHIDTIMEEGFFMPQAPPEIMVGIPADLLRRRPDIRAAEQQLIAQNSRIGGAVGDLYPIFSLNGSFGLDAKNFSDLWASEKLSANLGPSFRWNILNFGRYRSNVRLQEMSYQGLVATYQQTILLAAEEVDNALAAYAREKERLEKLYEAVESYEKALQYSMERYEGPGMVDFQRVLDTQRDKLSYEMLLTQSQANLMYDLIELYRALGGGWR